MGFVVHYAKGTYVIKLALYSIKMDIVFGHKYFKISTKAYKT